ncbi:hypothetical protein E3P92_02989 [Wallemia ichthyophaga]|uniref:Uncharacterized protein n=2 Tax=Wallemia ichthyophaga TaxID=245174 RepID=A0A4T0J2E1_WALIC|nr:uncharacterized protein J056_001462 [Wallemia ichthyophaga EXF-994]TIA84584.1 hypothetical protein E3P98_00117 [Wallemia ichthyophaga]EOQ99920.1 hypothetical protein J056_001462 [Wallemia ichthyophaga EXF-994]TIA89492.1 hypothetical protein E3P97_02996 [Wallemia ichthyophaga]TIB04284.1 hypothetical protein E3P95_00232 [Wallemia ichthyophaga]TIB05398.1 hypothetical protein E3P94_00232 [Wallemia ichthyophaga]
MHSPYKARVRHYTDSGDGRPSAAVTPKKEIENRKIADLEISNQALLTINKQLEQTRKKHLKEIKDLKEQLAQLQQQRRSPSPSSLIDGVEEEDADDSIENDNQFNKIRWSIQDLIEQGRDALGVENV